MKKSLSTSFNLYELCLYKLSWFYNFFLFYYLKYIQIKKLIYLILLSKRIQFA